MGFVCVAALVATRNIDWISDPTATCGMAGPAACCNSIVGDMRRN